MRKHFWKITSAAAAISIALALGVNSAFADSADSGNESAIVVIDEETMAKANAYAEVYEKAYDEALQKEMANIEADMEKFYDELLNGDARSVVEDPHVTARNNASKIAEEACEALGLERQKNVLTEMQNTDYSGWRGTFPVPSLKGYSYPFFDPPNYSTCITAGRIAKMEAKSGYSWNYKSVSVSVTYSYGTSASDSEKGVGAALTAEVPESNKKIVRADYTFTFFVGSTVTTDISEFVMVTLIVDE